MARRYTRPRIVAAALLTLLLSAASVAPAAGAGRASGVSSIPAVANPALLGDLNLSERAALARDAFVVTAPTLDRRDTNNRPFYLNRQAAVDPHHAVYWQFYDLYEENYSRGIPTFLTSDTLLHTFHVIYDQTLVALERAALAPKLTRLSVALLARTVADGAATGDARVRAAARLNVAYAAVAARLLDPQAKIPAPVASEVKRELALIAGRQGYALSPIVGYPVDYSKFVPRGHYAGDTTLSRYFQAMTWYGLLSFRLNAPDGALRTRQALLLTRDITRDAKLDGLWSAVFDPITAWAGRGDDLTVREYAAIMARVYGSGAPMSLFGDDARLRRFITLAGALPDPQIRGDLVPATSQALKRTKGLRLFGQRFTPDSSIMQALTWPNVGTPQQKRVWPSGLDIAATLGSRRAAALVTGAGPSNQTHYARYAQKLAQARQSYAALPAQAWRQNLYWGWLDTLRAVWDAPSPAAPAFMRTAAWADKSLTTGLGSWAELRHDTLLYVKQPQGGGGAGAPSIPPAYVEPVPAVYSRLLALTLQLKATLLKAGFLDSLPQPVYQYPPYTPPGYKGEKGYRGALDDFAGLVALAERVSEQELLGQAVSRTDSNKVATSFDDLGVLDAYFRFNAARRALQEVDMQVAAIADVYTEPLSGQVLEDGVGDVLPIYAVVTIDGRRWLARGGVYSYYEFHQPMSGRLGDDAWRHLSHRPALPSWTSGYMAY